MTPLKLCVVGHTNTGKTSLLRTLLRDSQFGEVSHQAATTRHVERASIGDGHDTLVWIFDTPGLEDAGGLLDWLEQNTSSRQDGVERLQAFLGADVAQADYAQEAKVLRQVLDSDMALYVIDAREPILGKYRDELTVLSWCARPVMPVFNFIAGQDLRAWREMLARRTLHVSSGFDTVAFDFAGEMQLWDDLATMLPTRALLDRLIAHRKREWHELEESALMHIGHFLLDVAAYRQDIPEDQDPMPRLATMQAQVRQLERQLHETLLQQYRFYHRALELEALVLDHIKQDPFDPELLKAYGVRTGSGMAAGAAMGMGIDAMALGTTLGLGTVLGGLLGGVLPNTRAISDKINGIKRLVIDAPTLLLLADRALLLLGQLMHRGHAAQTGFVVASATATAAARALWPADKPPAPVRKARGKPEWSSLNSQKPAQAALLRLDAVGQLLPLLQAGLAQHPE